MASDSGPAHSHHDFVDLLARAGAAPMQVVAAWKAQTFDVGVFSAEAHRIAFRQIEALKAEIEASKERSSDLQMALDQLEIARLELLASEEKDMRDAGPSFAQIFVHGFLGYFREKYQSFKFSSDISFNDLDTNDLIFFEDHTAAWSHQEFMTWAKDGFTRIRDESGSVHRAFAPIKVFPGSSIAHQLADAAKVARLIGLKWPAKLLDSAVWYFEAQRFVGQSEYDFALALWQVMALSEVDARIVSTAQLYLLALRNAKDFEQERKLQLTEAVVAAVVASEPASPAQSAFLRWLHDEERLAPFWQPKFTKLIVEAWLREISSGFYGPVPFETIRQSWFELFDWHESEISSLLRSETDSARALRAQVIQQLTNTEGINQQKKPSKGALSPSAVEKEEKNRLRNTYLKSDELRDYPDLLGVLSQ